MWQIHGGKETYGTQGRPVKAVEEEYQIDIVVFIRNGAVIVPADSTGIMVGDILIYQAQG